MIENNTPEEEMKVELNLDDGYKRSVCIKENN